MLASQIYGLSSILYTRFKGVSFISWLGVWQGDECVGGLSWWISPPKDIYEYA